MNCVSQRRSGDMKKMMANSPAIMAEIKQHVLDTKHKNCIKPNEDIVELCDDVEMSQLLWDGALAILHVKDPVEADYINRIQGTGAYLRPSKNKPLCELAISRDIAN